MPIPTANRPDIGLAEAGILGNFRSLLITHEATTHAYPQ